MFWYQTPVSSFILEFHSFAFVAFTECQCFVFRFLFFKKNFTLLFFFINLTVVFQLTVKWYCFSTTESHIYIIALTSNFFFLPHLGRVKVLEDDELENKDLDIKSEQIEEDAFENNNLLAETLKQPLQRLGKGLANGEYYVNASVEMLVPLYDLNQNNA